MKRKKWQGDLFVIDLRNVCFGYDKTKIIKNISFNIVKGEFAAIVGENGAGKSTLSKLLNGLLKPDSGKVMINGMDTKTAKSSILAKHIGFLFQNPDRQICKNTVREEILFGLNLAYNDKKQIEERLIKTLKDFDFDAESNPFNLSRGERQRIALASLIAIEPEILLLDEPTTGLDYHECMRIMGMIRVLNDKGVTVIMVCHDMEVVLDFAKRILVISAGELIADGETKKIFRSPDVLARASLIAPQVANLAVRLGDGFDDVFSVEEMTETLISRIKHERINNDERFS
jgi:energy-coupling factor transport system ATP-binding protein